VEGYVRPFHDGRHTSITNAAAAGTSPAALMARAGHSDFKTTQGYIDLAGETFRQEAELLARGAALGAAADAEVRRAVRYKNPVQRRRFVTG
jgi:integrase